ncbi:DUF1963 domain-containing protein [Streptomyces piniterrae]|uniref:DUF1963 domain-containing protein n=2 Tax=Streptomyces piniterrae TaxID=2571125 RepID=A0A4U0NIZ8_9ACTN|nr:DUF1963 domain-containing protein [Streptomyces piniterrae]
MDVEQLFPELASLQRQTVRLHPRAGSPTSRDSSVGGPLLWPEQDPWSACPEHPGSPMVPVLQLYAADALDLVPFPPGCDLLQVLWCPRDHDGRWVIPEVHWRDAAAIGSTCETPPAPTQIRFGRIPKPCVVHPELVIEYPSWDLDDGLWDTLEPRFVHVEAETGWDYQYHLSTAPGTKLGGHPGWCQDPQWPDCSECGKPMDHLLTVESTEADAVSRLTWTPIEDQDVEYEDAALMLGDMGGVYLFECRTCPGRPYKDRFDCS